MVPSLFLRNSSLQDGKSIYWLTSKGNYLPFYFFNILPSFIVQMDVFLDNGVVQSVEIFYQNLDNTRNTLQIDQDQS